MWILQGGGGGGGAWGGPTGGMAKVQDDAKTESMGDGTFETWW